MGKVGDLLFDDTTWKVRWLVVDTASWLTGRKILMCPLAIGNVDHEQRIVSVSLTKAQVKDSPAILLDQPVSRQMQTGLLDYYGWNPLWEGNQLELDTISSRLAPTLIEIQSSAPAKSRCTFEWYPWTGRALVHAPDVAIPPIGYVS